jgi:hypothetical protein
LREVAWPAKDGALAFVCGPTSFVEWVATHEKEAIEAALRECKGRVAGPFGAAVRLGVPSSTLESKSPRCLSSSALVGL